MRCTGRLRAQSACLHALAGPEIRHCNDTKWYRNCVTDTPHRGQREPVVIALAVDRRVFTPLLPVGSPKTRRSNCKKRTSAETTKLGHLARGGFPRHRQAHLAGEGARPGGWDHEREVGNKPFGPRWTNSDLLCLFRPPPR